MALLLRDRTWQISDAPFQPGKIHHTGTIYTIGNGYMGLRGTFEEGYPGEIVSTLVHGIFDHAEGELVPDLVNLPNPLPIRIEVDGEAFHMDRGRVLGYRRMLDLETATLTRGIIWRSDRDAIIQITFDRFVSLDMEHVIAQRVSVRALSGTCRISVVASIDGTQTNEGTNHWGTITAGGSDKGYIGVVGKTGQSQYSVAVASALETDAKTAREISSTGLSPSIRMTCSLERDQLVTFCKFSAIHSTRDVANPLKAAYETLDAARACGWESLHAAHVGEWAKYWYDSGIDIEGDEVAQRAIRFATYHVLIAAPRHDERVSIGAKTLSGPGYKGHAFWDTELFMLPMLTVTQPRLARNLLMYRYHNLPGARHKAQKTGYEGAMFPWESTDTGEETTPQWTAPYPDGKRIRIWTGDTEQHISSDIAYATMQYWHWTGEDDFFVNYGAELVLDTAVFWGSRAEYNAAKDRYELTMQIGPDEYHENINNSAFTNSMVRWHLRTAIQVCEWLRRTHPSEGAALLSRLGIAGERLEHWRMVAEKIYIPFDKERGILEQFDGFFKLEPINLSYWQPRVANMDFILGHEETQRVMVIKQADIVMLMSLLGEEVGNREERLRNWQFYSTIVDHGSSLSPSTHAWVAARLGLIEDAYRLFMFAATIDLEDAKGNVHDGIHAAASGGLWEAVTFGFAGLSVKDGKFNVEPQLPPHWKSLRFRVRCQGEQHTIQIPAPV